MVNMISWNLFPKYSHSWPCFALTAGVRSSKETTMVVSSDSVCAATVSTVSAISSTGSL